MITYQEIYDILRNEKYNEALQQLPKKFLSEIASYLAEKKDIVNREQKNSELFSDTVRMTRKQLDNTLAIIKEIIAIRERKILNLAFTAALTGISKRDTENLMEHEKDLFEITVKKLEQNQKIITEKLNGKINEEKKDLKNILIRFKEDIPAFLSGEGTELGPFKSGDVVNLPQEIAEILLGDGKAAMVEEK
ncbi:MAG: hypothetical protein IB618_03540 [Candidatus Pacearchaeota archaeon]|nr:MAG: hypothetical protein IB618_03540 [Candidatus Pacearchaeota archaeon]